MLFLSSDSLKIDDLRWRTMIGGAKSPEEEVDEDVKESDRHMLKVGDELLPPF